MGLKMVSNFNIEINMDNVSSQVFFSRTTTYASIVSVKTVFLRSIFGSKRFNFELHFLRNSFLFQFVRLITIQYWTFDASQIFGYEVQKVGLNDLLFKNCFYIIIVLEFL